MKPDDTFFVTLKDSANKPTIVKVIKADQDRAMLTPVLTNPKLGRQWHFTNLVGQKVVMQQHRFSPLARVFEIISANKNRITIRTS